MVFSMIHPRRDSNMQTGFSLLFNPAALHTSPFFFHLFCILIYIFTTAFSVYRLSSLWHVELASFLYSSFLAICAARWVFWDSERFWEPLWLFSGLCVCVSVRPVTAVRSSLPFRWICGVLVTSGGRHIEQCLFLSSSTLWQCYICPFKNLNTNNIYRHLSDYLTLLIGPPLSLSLPSFLLTCSSDLLW